MVTITLKGREIPLLYTTYEMKMIQEEIAPISKAVNIVMGRNPDDEKDQSRYASAEHLDALAKAVRILGNAGLEEAGETPDLTDKWILRAMRPSKIPQTVSACMDAMAEGMKSEIPEKETDEPVDVTLEEMKKKETKAG